MSQNLLQKSVDKDTAWAITGLPDKEKRMPPLGFWTSFQKETAIENMKKIKISYLSTIAKSREYPVCKTYLHFLVGTIVEVLKLPYIFVQAFEQVYARVLHIIWRHKDLYSKIIPIMDGFHQMRFFQTVLFKRYNCLGLQDCFVDSEITAAGLVSQTFEGRHYYCSIHLHQEGFDALVKKKQKVLLVNLSLYIRTFSVISQNSGKDHQAKLWTRHQYKIQRATVEATVNYER